MWYLESGVVLDCIDSSSLPHFLLWTCWNVMSASHDVSRLLSRLLSSKVAYIANISDPDQTASLGPV